MNKVISVIFLIILKFSFSQNVEDSLYVENVLKFDSLINSRLELYYYDTYNIGYSDTIVLEDTILVNDVWNLSVIFDLCCDESKNKTGFSVLSKFLDWHISQGRRIKILELGYRSSIPDANAFQENESLSGYFYVPTVETIGCIRDKCTGEIVDYINIYTK